MDHDALWKALGAALEIRRSPNPEAAVAEAAAGPRHALSPWALWTLGGVARHLRRQQRVAEIVRGELGVDLALAARAGWRGPPEGVPPYGEIDGESAYRFHENGISFKDGGRHVTLDIDLLDGDLEHIDAEGLGACLRSIPGVDAGDVPLFALHFSLETLGYAFDELVELGLLQPRVGASRYKRLSGEVALPHAMTLVNVGYAIDRADPREEMVMFAVLGDWVQADRIAKNRPSLAPSARVFTAPRAAEQKAARRERLLAQKHVDREGTVVTALIELDRVDALEHVREALAGPLDLRCLTAMQHVRCDADVPWHRDPDYAADVIALFRRLDLEGHGYEHLLWRLCAGYLLARGLHVDEVLASFSSLGECLVAGAAIVALEHVPDLAVPVLRRGLHAEHAAVRADAIAILVLLGEPWGASLVVEALATSGDLECTLEWRVGLRMLGDPEGAVRAWEEAHPPTKQDREAQPRSEAWVRERMREWKRDARLAGRQKDARAS